MERIKDKHKGKRIWVCGSGGSLMDVIPSQIPKDDIVICCNSSTYHFPRFDYGVFTDGTANYSRWYHNLTKKKCTIILLNTEIQVIKKGTIQLEKDFNKWKFNPEDTKIIGGYDVVHCAVHIAYLMGASEIILAGVDLKHVSKTKKHAYSQELMSSCPEDLLETILPTFNANNEQFDGHLGASLSGWERIHAHNQLKIFTISNDTNLKLYPHKQFSELCNK